MLALYLDSHFRKIIHMQLSNKGWKICMFIVLGKNNLAKPRNVQNDKRLFVFSPLDDKKINLILKNFIKFENKCGRLVTFAIFCSFAHCIYNEVSEWKWIIINKVLLNWWAILRFEQTLGLILIFDRYLKAKKK